MLDPLFQETYNVHRLAGGSHSSFRKMYPHIFRDDLQELEKKWKEVEKQEKANHRSWAPENTRTRGLKVSGAHGFLE
ncbi:MAG: hypothetical protein AAB587_02320 [Patescibacteria group bacterium]